MTLVREPGTQKVAEFTVPFAGTWNSIAANMLIPGAIYLSHNVFIRKGKLRTRPGLGVLNATVFDGVVIGGDMAVSAAGKILLAFTKSRLFSLKIVDEVWQGVETLPLAASDESLIDICFLETNNEYVGIIANGETRLKRWIDTETTIEIVPSVGVVPIAKSVCIAARRVVALVAPHTLRWTAIFDYTNWSELNFNKVAQTNDEAICVRALGTLDFVVYKERSIYLGKAQAGSDASAFSVKFVQECEGPAGVHAVVEADGMHIYMTASGRIGIFNGSSLVQWVADGLWIQLQADIDISWAYKIFGVYDYRLYTVTFYYPRHNSAGAMHGMVIINLPLEGTGITTYAAFTGESAIPMSYGYEMRFDNRIPRSMMFSSPINNRQSFVFDELLNTDDELPFSCSFQTALAPLPDMRHHMLSVESFLEREHGNGHVRLEGIKSDALENEAGIAAIESNQLINLEFTPTQEYIGLNMTARWIGLRYSWESPSTVKFGGAVMYGAIRA
jgi:hypothetical protein